MFGFTLYKCKKRLYYLPLNHIQEWCQQICKNQSVCNRHENYPYFINCSFKIIQIKDNIIDHLNSCRTIYAEKLTENFNAIKEEYEDLLKDKDDNEINLQKIKDFEDKIEKIKNHLENINNLEKEIKNYVK